MFPIFPYEEYRMKVTNTRDLMGGFMVTTTMGWVINSINIKKL